MTRLLLVLCFAVGLAACKKTFEKGSNPPQITFISVSPSEFKVGQKGDVAISFRFADKDADIGNGTNVQIRALDTNFGPAAFPRIPEEFQDVENGIEGIATVYYPIARLNLDSTHMQTGDTFRFALYINDQANNQSNIIETSEVIIKP